MHEFGEIVLAEVQFTDTFETKLRPALILFEEFGNIVVIGITSNLDMEGIKISKKEGALKDSIIKINYIFTISEKMIKKSLFILSKEKKKIVLNEIIKRLKID
jgi:mRNA interferase MazF